MQPFSESEGENCCESMQSGGRGGHAGELLYTAREANWKIPVNSLPVLDFQAINFMLRISAKLHLISVIIESDRIRQDGLIRCRTDTNWWDSCLADCHFLRWDAHFYASILKHAFVK